jgi:hypothetical protein
MEHHFIKERASKLGLRGGDLAALANISAPKLSNYFRGRAPLDSTKRAELLQVLDDLEALENHFPIPLGLHDMKLTALMLERFRTGRFSSFLRLTRAIDWRELPEGLSRKYPKVFKGKE